MSDQTFIALEDITTEHWKEIEELADQVLKTDVFGKNKYRSAIAAFVIWLTENSIGVDLGEVEKPKRRKKRCTSTGSVH